MEGFSQDEALKFIMPDPFDKYTWLCNRGLDS